MGPRNWINRAFVKKDKVLRKIEEAGIRIPHAFSLKNTHYRHTVPWLGEFSKLTLSP